MDREEDRETDDDVYGLIQVHHDTVLVQDRHGGDTVLGEEVDDVEDSRLERRGRQRPVR